ncbi:amidohydrolase [Saccharopolyspora sp. WRP15-2]|uniref:Peptidase M20 domain-containing protein 2 n=1 Tax=Saccharopolyspora oryzae TaxID=2997343 RepID=A0ABT4V9U6_9PSEU|nr:amidohydrolase [Saccharopolyspora oryzae]MDA3630735.1 amidohydrolase [Saccharopolyspora oryzae]
MSTTSERTDRLRQQAIGVVDDWAARLIELSHAIHANPELSYQEHDSAALVAETIRSAGFDTTVGAYGLDTDIEAVSGEGELTIALCSEYDALPDVGHACGHNIIAAIGVGAAIAVASVATELGLRVKLLGTPAEEHGGGKADMLRAGAWEDVTFSMMAHGISGADLTCDAHSTTAVERFEVEYLGRAAHAAAAPQAGINAGAAANIALTAISHLRQHIGPGARINAFISHGGEATNIIPERTVVQAEVRAYDLDEWRELKKRALACFEAGAVATGCEWKHRRTENPYAPMNSHPGLAAAWDRNLVSLGRTPDPDRIVGGGSTDMGNVSQVVPTIHPLIAVLGSDAVPHHPAFAAAAATPEADAAVLDGAKALALTAIDAASDPQFRSELLQLQADRPTGATRIEF